MSTRPNVIVFMSDQQRFDTSGLHGNPLNLTPNFDRLAMENTHVFQSISCQPVCGPARATLQCGQYGTTCGVWKNGETLPQDAPTLAKSFREAGYRTGYIGKWHLAGGCGPQDIGPVPQARRGGYEYWLGAELVEFCSEPYNCVLYDNDNKPVKLPGYRPDATTDAAIRYIDRMQDEPFFLFLSVIEPHHQNHVMDYVPPAGFREPFEGRWMPPDLAALRGQPSAASWSGPDKCLAGYWGATQRVDQAFGRMMDALQSLNLADRTVVLYTADHGCHFGTREGWDKRSCHEASVRVPTLLAGPGFRGGGRIRQNVSLADLPPTLLDAAGLRVPETFQGRSILPLVGGRGGSDWDNDVLIQISESHVGRAIRTRRWKYAVKAEGLDGFAVPGSDSYVESELYDLQHDPYELFNLIGGPKYAGLRASLRERLVRQMVRAGEKAPTIVQAGLETMFPGGTQTLTQAEIEQ